MNVSNVTPKQAKAISAWLTPTMLQLFRLRARMIEVEFPDDDSLLRLVTEAADAMRKLSASLNEIEGRPVPPTWRQAYMPTPPPPARGE